MVGILPTRASISDAGEAGKREERKDFLDLGEGEGRSMWTAGAEGTREERYVDRWERGKAYDRNETGGVRKGGVSKRTRAEGGTTRGRRDWRRTSSALKNSTAPS